jgi:hypothetical protein
MRLEELSNSLRWRKCVHNEFFCLNTWLLQRSLLLYLRLYLTYNLRKENLFLHLLHMRRCSLIVSIFHHLSSSLSLTNSDPDSIWVDDLHIFIFEYNMLLFDKFALCIFWRDPSCVSLTGDVQQKYIERTGRGMAHIGPEGLHYDLHDFSWRLHSKNLHFTHKWLKLEFSELECGLNVFIINFMDLDLIVLNFVRLALALQMILALK